MDRSSPRRKKKKGEITLVGYIEPSVSTGLKDVSRLRRSSQWKERCFRVRHWNFSKLVRALSPVGYLLTKTCDASLSEAIVEDESILFYL